MFSDGAIMEIGGVRDSWLEIKNTLHDKWGKVNVEEFDKTKGDRKAINVLVNNEYRGDDESNYRIIEEIFERFDPSQPRVTCESTKCSSND